MRPIDFELMVDRAIERALKRQSVEDMHVELKREWISEFDFARHLAGLCNAAIGAPVTVVIGVDEKAGELLDAAPVEMADWWAKVRKQFDGEAPLPLHHRNLERAGTQLVAMQFSSELAPYVVKNPNGGQFSLEVPWRENNSTRSARRENLLRILAPWVRAPTIELLTASLDYKSTAENGGRRYACRWILETDFFITQPQDQQSVFAAHRTAIAVHCERGTLAHLEGDSFHMPNLAGISSSLSTIGPAHFRMRAIFSEALEADPPDPPQSVELSIWLTIPNCDKEIALSCQVDATDHYKGGMELTPGSKRIEWYYSLASPQVAFPGPTIRESPPPSAPGNALGCNGFRRK